MYINLIKIWERLHVELVLHSTVVTSIEMYVPILYQI